MTDLIQFSRYGMTLKKLESNDIEMVRQWRNDPKIASQMLDQTYITSEMQKQWFEKIQSSPHHYCFVACFKGDAIGFCSVTRRKEQNDAEVGLYIYDDRYRGNIVPFCLAFALLDFCFESLNCAGLFARVLNTNTQAIRFNAACGYKVDHAINTDLTRYTLNDADYLSSRNKMSRFIRYES